MLFIDECHLLWDDARGYAWGKANERVCIPMINFRERQTYYGAIEHKTGEVTVCPAIAGSGDATVAFIRSLREKYVTKRLLIVWDGATYHKGIEMVRYLGELNVGRETEEWLVTCCLFAAHAPEQNPIEDIWLKAKRYIRKHWRLCDQFASVKHLFLEAIHNQRFDFPKLHSYG